MSLTLIRVTLIPMMPPVSYLPKHTEEYHRSTTSKVDRFKVGSNTNLIETFDVTYSKTLYNFKIYLHISITEVDKINIKSKKV